MQYGLSDKYADEISFIREIMFDVTDDTPRMIYADWLDERNDSRSQFLRLDLRLSRLAADDAQVEPLQLQRSKLIRRLDRQWVSLLARSPIELCPQKVEFKFMCPKRWENLQPFGDDLSVRYCDQCGKSVTYCLTMDDVRYRVRGQCVAIDSGVQRRAGDLENLESEYYGETLGLVIYDE